MTITDAGAAISAKIALRRRLPPPPMRRALRQAAGLSTLEVASCLGVTRQAVSQWERGERTPREELLAAYIDALDAMSTGSRPEVVR
jgi:DNA-binding transcriptional regulator YiaG